MTHKKINPTQSKTARKNNKYSPQFKEQAVERAKKDGVAKVDLTLKKRTNFLASKVYTMLTPSIGFCAIPST